MNAYLNRVISRWMGNSTSKVGTFRQGAISLDGYWALWNEEFIEPLRDSPLPSFSFLYIPVPPVALKLRGSPKFGTYRARIFLQPEQMKEPLALSLRGYHAAASILIKTEQGAINF